MATLTSAVSNRWKRKPKRRFPPETLTDAEVRALLDACAATSATGIRNRALIAILYRSGLRVSEALSLYPKGPGPAARCDLRPQRQGRQVRACHGHGPHKPIFCTTSGEPLTAGYVRRWLPG